MYRKTVNAHFSPYYLVAIPYGPRTCFEIGAPVHETTELIILTYGAMTQTAKEDEYVGGILVVKKAYQRLLLEAHQTYDSARHSFEFWVRHFNDPRVEKLRSADADTGAPYEFAQLSSDEGLNDFSSLSPRKIAPNGILDMRFADDALRHDVVRAFGQGPDWEKVLLSWASTGFGDFIPLFCWRDQEAASRDSKLFLEERIGAPCDDLPF